MSQSIQSEMVRIKNGVGEVRLTDQIIRQVEEVAKSNPRDYLFFRLMAHRGFRISAITGDKKRTVKYTRRLEEELADGTLVYRKVKVEKEYPAYPGIRKDDVTPEGVTVYWKGGQTVFKYLPMDLAKDLYSYSRHFKGGERLFAFTRQRGWQICREYLKALGIPSWNRVHPHRFRHYFGTYWARETGRDPWKVKSLMGHKDLRSTATYVEELSPEEEKEILR